MIANGDLPKWVPLGLPLGMCHELASTTPPQASLRVGDRRIELAPALYDAWMRLRFAGLTIGAGGEVPPSVVAELEQRRVLLRMPDDVEDRAAVVEPLVATAAGIGAGNSERHPDVFVIISPRYEPLALVDWITYSVWSLCGGGRTLGGACRAVAEAVEVSAATVCATALAALPVLIASAALFVEPPVEG